MKLKFAGERCSRRPQEDKRLLEEAEIFSRISRQGQWPSTIHPAYECRPGDQTGFCAVTNIGFAAVLASREIAKPDEIYVARGRVLSPKKKVLIKDHVWLRLKEPEWTIDHTARQAPGVSACIVIQGTAEHPVPEHGCINQSHDVPGPPSIAAEALDYDPRSEVPLDKYKVINLKGRYEEFWRRYTHRSDFLGFAALDWVPRDWCDYFETKEYNATIAGQEDPDDDSMGLMRLR